MDDDKGFDLVAMGRSFPVPRGFAYYGDDFPAPSFGAITKLHVETSDQSDGLGARTREPLAATIEYISDSDQVASASRDLGSLAKIDW
ncbi:MAG: hypothetical protein AAFY15_00860, partial [Cyanobacteria bacterium J06648_11]